MPTANDISTVASGVKAARGDRSPPNLRRSLVVFGALAVVVGVVFKNRWHEPWLTPGVHALRAAGGHVGLESRKSEWIRALGGEDFLATVDWLSLDNEKLSDAQVAALIRPFSEAQSLDLAKMQLGPATAAQLERFSKLRWVSFSHLPVTEELLTALGHSRSLMQIRLYDVQLQRQSLRALTSLTQLKHISVENSNVIDAQLADLCAAPGLASLDLGRCSQITDAAWPHLAQLTKVTRLDLNDTAMTGAGIAQLAPCTCLTNLSLSGTELTDNALAELASLPKLARLLVARTSVSDTGLAHLAGLTNLNQLDLANTQVTDAGLSTIATLNRLTWLSLDGTAVTDRALVELSCLPKLYSLDLRRTNVTNAGLLALSGFPQLNSLNLHGTAVTDEAVIEFLRRNPRMTIQSDGGSRSP